MQSNFFEHDRHNCSGPHFPSSLPTVALEIRRGRAHDLVRPVEVPVFLIGTAHDCDMVLGDPQFPEVYTYLFINDNGVSVRHLGTGPELTVNGVVHHSAQIEDGDRIRCGSYEFVVRVEWPAAVGGLRNKVTGSYRGKRITGKTPAAQRRIDRLLREIGRAVYPGSVALSWRVPSSPELPPAVARVRRASA